MNESVKRLHEQLKRSFPRYCVRVESLPPYTDGEFAWQRVSVIIQINEKMETQAINMVLIGDEPFESVDKTVATIESYFDNRVAALFGRTAGSALVPACEEYGDE